MTVMTIKNARKMLEPLDDGQIAGFDFGITVKRQGSGYMMRRGDDILVWCPTPKNAAMVVVGRLNLLRKGAE